LKANKWKNISSCGSQGSRRWLRYSLVGDEDVVEFLGNYIQFIMAVLPNMILMRIVPGAFEGYAPETAKADAQLFQQTFKRLKNIELKERNH